MNDSLLYQAYGVKDYSYSSTEYKDKSIYLHLKTKVSKKIVGSDLSYTKVAQQLAEDEYRNIFIVKDVVEVLKEGRSPIILTSRTSHVTALAELLKPHCPNVITLIGSESTNIRTQNCRCWLRCWGW